VKLVLKYFNLCEKYTWTTQTDRRRTDVASPRCAQHRTVKTGFLKSISTIYFYFIILYKIFRIYRKLTWQNKCYWKSLFKAFYEVKLFLLCRLRRSDHILHWRLSATITRQRTANVTGIKHYHVLYRYTYSVMDITTPCLKKTVPTYILLLVCQIYTDFNKNWNNYPGINP